MRQTNSAFSLLLTGARPRLLGAALIILVLWAGFFWATGLPLPLIGAAQ